MKQQSFIVFVIFSLILVFCLQSSAIYVCRYANSNTALECSQQHTKKQALNDLSFVRSLEISNRLKTLRIKNSKISKIQSNAFRRFENIIELDVSSNKIETFDENAYGPLIKLRSLNISSNMIKSLRADHFKGLRDLRVLDISKNELSITDDVEPPFTSLTNLRTLILSGNTEIDLRLVVNCNSLETLIVSDVQLTLENNIFNKTPLLYKLVMSNCALGSLPSNLFHPCRKLNKLDISNNKIAFVPPKMFENNKELSMLDLSRNALISIDAEMLVTNAELLTLNMSRNNIDMLHNQTFISQSKLVTLDLSFNKLEKIPKSFSSSLRSLQYLDLSFNKISELPDEFCAVCSQLDYLDLSHNFLWSINVDLLHFFPLRRLHISNNNLESFPLTRVINSLEELDLDKNKMTKIPSILRFLPSLTSLMISCNRLSILPGDFFDHLTRSVDLRLRGNPWLCHCLEETLDRTVQSQVVYQTEGFTDGLQPFCIVDKLISCNGTKPILMLPKTVDIFEAQCTSFM